MELELKHIAPYLPYGLEMAYRSHKTGIYEPRGSLVGVTNRSFETHPVRLLIEGMDFEHIWMFKPILRPLHEFNDALEVEDFIGLGNSFDAYDEFFNSWVSDLANTDKLVLQAPQPIFNYFLANHFDVFGLIPQGLAVDINTLKSE